MIERLRGHVNERGVDWFVLELGPMSLRLNTTGSTMNVLGLDADVSVFTYLHMREDAMTLYGFATHSERELFERLIGVSGVGPRVAQQMLTALTVDALVSAFDNEDIDTLVRVPGVGRKTAQRVILELKGKLAATGAAPQVQPSSRDKDLLRVLQGLGYSPVEAAEAIGQSAPVEGQTDEERLRAALRHFASA